jgi:hypothetical protein
MVVVAAAGHNQVATLSARAVLVSAAQVVNI